MGIKIEDNLVIQSEYLNQSNLTNTYVEFEEFVDADSAFGDKWKNAHLELSRYLEQSLQSGWDVYTENGTNVIVQPKWKGGYSVAYLLHKDGFDAEIVDDIAFKISVAVADFVNKAQLEDFIGGHNSNQMIRSIEDRMNQIENAIVSNGGPSLEDSIKHLLGITPFLSRYSIGGMV